MCSPSAAFLRSVLSCSGWKWKGRILLNLLLLEVYECFEDVFQLVSWSVGFSRYFYPFSSSHSDLLFAYWFSLCRQPGWSWQTKPIFYQFKKFFCGLWCLLQFGKCSEPDWQKQRLAVFLSERLAGIITALCIYWPASFTAHANFRYVEWQLLWVLAKGLGCTFPCVLFKWKRTAQQMVWLEACLAGTIKTLIWGLSLLEMLTWNIHQSTPAS